jgi:hypothetical protein
LTLRLENLMKWPLEIGIFAAAVMAGSLLGGLVPPGLIPQSWRIPIAALLVGIGIALAVIGFS